MEPVHYAILQIHLKELEDDHLMSSICSRCSDCVVCHDNTKRRYSNRHPFKLTTLSTTINVYHFPSTIILWNNLPTTVVICNSLESFKKEFLKPII